VVRKVIVLPSAEKEMDEAFDWYEEHQDGLGERFINSVERQIKRIVANPEHYQLKKRKYRESNVEVFPYIVVFKYYPIKSEILVVSVFHTSRKPSKKHRK
jgi:plasmid stabilization system protein ParE